MTDFKPESLIPLIGVTRKLTACDSQQQLLFLQQLPSVFDFHKSVSILRDIIISGLCNQNIYELIPDVLYDDLLSILPSDKQLNLRDTVYESRLVEAPVDLEQDQQSKYKKKKLPLTLLRIPTDVQCHLFHFLNAVELTKVQRVCRALCIVARNPSSLQSLYINLRSAENHYFVKRCYSQPKALIISSWRHHNGRYAPKPPIQPLTGSTKWGEHVVDLKIQSEPSDRKNVILNLAPFVKLRKCLIGALPSILLNGTISSYDTLQELYLDHVPLTGDIIDHIHKFKNLKLLSLSSLKDTSLDAVQQRTKPICLQQLETLAMEVGNREFGEFQRTLIGSHPKTFKIASTSDPDPSDILAISIPEIPVIDHLNIIYDGSMSFSIALSQWFESTQSEGRKLFNETSLYIDLPNHLRGDETSSLLGRMTSSVLPIFRCSKTSRLRVNCQADELSECNIAELVDGISDAPNGVFTEIKIEIDCTPLQCGKKHDEYCLERMANSLDDNECTESDHDVVKGLFMEYVDDVEQWMEPWLVFDETQMKRIGLRKLNVEVKCNMRHDNLQPWAGGRWTDELEAKEIRYQKVLNEMSNQWVKERIEYWKQSERESISITASPDYPLYTIEFALSIGDSE